MSEERLKAERWKKQMGKSFLAHCILATRGNTVEGARSTYGKWWMLEVEVKCGLETPDCQHMLLEVFKMVGKMQAKMERKESECQRKTVSSNEFFETVFLTSDVVDWQMPTTWSWQRHLQGRVRMAVDRDCQV